MQAHKDCNKYSLKILVTDMPIFWNILDLQNSKSALLEDFSFIDVLYCFESNMKLKVICCFPENKTSMHSCGEGECQISRERNYIMNSFALCYESNRIWKKIYLTTKENRNK